jgi:hypothetical protein
LGLLYRKAVEPTPAVHCYRMRKTAVVLCLALAALPAIALDHFELWPGVNYDPRIPTFHQVLGYDPGERITPHAGLVRYLEALAAASPRLKVFDLAEGWEGANWCTPWSRRRRTCSF